MTGTLRRLLSLAHAPRARVAAAVLLASATVVCSVGLMATAGYLISRAAERPAVLSLTVAIVAVRFFGLSRPILRYLERLASHDLAFRVLGRVRVRVYERIEPLAPVELDGYRRGDLLSRMVADVDALQNLHLRGVGPPLVAAVAGAACVGAAAAVLPAAGLVLAAGLLLAGVAVPAISGTLARRAGRHQASARADLTAELVELLQAAPELVVYGREQERLDRVRVADRTLVRLARRDAFAAGVGDGLTLLVTGATVAGVLAVSVSAHAAGHLDRVLIATLALLALASFEAVQPLSAAARELSATIAAGRAHPRADRPRAARRRSRRARAAAAPARRRRTRGRSRPLPGRRCARPRRRQPVTRPRRPDCPRRRERRREDHRREPPAPVPRPGRGPGDPRRP